jgi:predicted XRE-type DNA-binding protein
MPVKAGSANVFADLGFPKAEELKIKVGLTRQIADQIRALEWTPAQASKVLGVSQSIISKLLQGRYTGVSNKRLRALLDHLDAKADFPLTKAQIAELERRVKDIDDPTRWVVVSTILPRTFLAYVPSSGMFVGDEIPGAALFKRKAEAEAVLRVLEGRRSKKSRDLQVLEVKQTKQGVRVVQKVVDFFRTPGSRGQSGFK